MKNSGARVEPWSTPIMTEFGLQDILFISTSWGLFLRYVVDMRVPWYSPYTNPVQFF